MRHLKKRVAGWALLFAGLGLAVIIAGCGYPRKVSASRPGLPEEIFSYPCIPNMESRYRALVFRFTEPAHLRGMGKQAARYLYQELMRRGTFSGVGLDLETDDLRPEQLLYIAKQKRYNMIVTGEILYALDGGISHPSQVDQQLTVWGIAGRDLKLCCSAKASDRIAPAPSFDLIAVQGGGAPAPSSAALMQRNAEKFANLLTRTFQTLPPSQ